MKKDFIFVGLDISTNKTGACMLKNGVLSDFALIDRSAFKNDSEERMEEMAKGILEQLDKWKPQMIYVEDSWNAANIQTTKMLTRLMGVSFAWAMQHDAEWHDILPARWRKLCGIEQGKKKRAELKEASISYVKDRYNIKVNDDVADAIAMSDGVMNYYSSLDDE